MKEFNFEITANENSIEKYSYSCLAKNLDEAIEKCHKNKRIWNHHEQIESFGPNSFKIEHNGIEVEKVPGSDMVNNVLFTRLSEYTGRNGNAKLKGIGIIRYQNGVFLYPINSRGIGFNTFYKIPIEDLDNLIDHLYQLKQ